ncbi:MAG TPA: STM3941 family protein [Drouetiella sp.]|jgi:hypothetical protein
MQDDETLVLYNSKGKYARLLFICALFVICGITIVTSDHSQSALITGWSSIVFFGLGIVVAIRQMLDNKPRIIIDALGIHDRTLKVGLIEWADIQDASLTRIQREHFIQLDLSDEHKYLERLSTGHKRAARANTFLGYQKLNINLSGVACNPGQILNIVRQESGYARNSKGSGG